MRASPLASTFVAFASNEAGGHVGSLPDRPTLNAATVTDPDESLVVSQSSKKPTPSARSTGGNTNRTRGMRTRRRGRLWTSAPPFAFLLPQPRRGESR